MTLFPFDLPARASKGREPFVVLALCLAVLAIYGQTVAHPFAVPGDAGYVYENEHVRSGLKWASVHWAWTTLQEGGWQPFMWLSLMLDAQFYGLTAGGYHLTNVLLHAGGTLLLFRWLRVTTKAPLLAALAAFLFAAHPAHVATVARVSARGELLGTLFFCLLLLAYTRYAWSGLRRMRYFWLAWLAYALGLLATPTLVVVPPLLLLLDYWPLRRFPAAAIREHWLRLVVEKVPFGVLASSSCLLTPFDLRQPGPVSALLAVGTALEKTFWPVHLGGHDSTGPGVPLWLPVAWGIVLAALTLVAWWRWRQQPYLIVGWLWFLGALVLGVELMPVGGQAMVDHHAYLPHVGLFVAVCWAGGDAWQRWPRVRPWLLGAAAAGAAACLILSIRQARAWHGDAVPASKNNAAARNVPAAASVQVVANRSAPPRTSPWIQGERT